MTKSELRDRIKRDLGYPYIKVELTENHLNDAIEEATEKWLEWTIGNATREYYFTLPLSAGQTEYKLPEYVTDIVSYNEGGIGSNINTLFTLENYFYSAGIIDPNRFMNDGLVEYQIALDFLETLERYTVNEYTYQYSRKDRILKISPEPELQSVTTIDNEEYNFAGYLLIKSYAYDGCFTSSWDISTFMENLYSETWVKKYSVALAKIALGYIRRKYSGNTPIGNVGISLDGEQLVSEGKEEIDKLAEELDLEYAYDGYGFEIG